MFEALTGLVQGFTALLVNILGVKVERRQLGISNLESTPSCPTSLHRPRRSWDMDLGEESSSLKTWLAPMQISVATGTQWGCRREPASIDLWGKVFQLN